VQVGHPFPGGGELKKRGEAVCDFTAVHGKGTPGHASGPHRLTTVKKKIGEGVPREENEGALGNPMAEKPFQESNRWAARLKVVEVVKDKGDRGVPSHRLGKANSVCVAVHGDDFSLGHHLLEKGRRKPVQALLQLLDKALDKPGWVPIVLDNGVPEILRCPFGYKLSRQGGLALTGLPFNKKKAMP